jgi:hypothetical protein
VISDAAPEAVQHVVLVEEEISIGDDDHRWQLAKTIQVEGDHAAADACARELAMEYIPQDIRLDFGETAGRSVFRVSDGSWLVEVRGGTYDHERVLVRITTAERVHTQEYVPYAPPAKDTAPHHKRRLWWRG